METRFQGVFPALITPLTKYERLNAPALEKLLAYEMAQGADGFYIGGATGEGLLLDLPERKRLCEKSVEYIGDRGVKIVHIADMNFRDTVALAKHAEACGADAISSIAPIYFKYDEDEIFNYYKAIAESVKLPLIIYYTAAAGVTISHELFARLFSIDNITGVKWTSSNYYEMIRLRERFPRANIFNGPDEMLVCGLAAGADGGIGSTYNVMYPLIRRIYDCFRAGDTAGALASQQQADKIIAVMLRYSVIPVCKLILEELGIEVGAPSFPMEVYEDEKREQIHRELIDAGFVF
ncbi:MAG: dihydrodipicolinate synthase family protein [Clostridia bacterium]|nr:dihydrodipicolinate synthase family protein [Clostridia bacterium]